ncbi:MAG: hypothetical protein PHU85_15420 [Phycisphaerae bacterium]|nr:hypothetical protein [Phycisphaerae bacterium]
MTRTHRLFALALAVTALAGCQGSDVYFRPVSHDIGLGPGPVERARYVVATQPDGIATATLSVRGFLAEKRKNQPPADDRIIVTVTARSRVSGEVTLPIGQFYLIDDDGVRMEHPESFSREAGGDALVIPPGGKARATLTFDVPGGRNRLLTIGTVRLFWSARSGGRTQEFVTKFIRSAQPEVYYYPDDYSYPYYYDPYPYPYGYPYYYGERVIIERHRRY